MNFVQRWGNNAIQAKAIAIRESPQSKDGWMRLLGLSAVPRVGPLFSGWDGHAAMQAIGDVVLFTLRASGAGGFAGVLTPSRQGEDYRAFITMGAGCARLASGRGRAALTSGTFVEIDIDRPFILGLPSGAQGLIVLVPTRYWQESPAADRVTALGCPEWQTMLNRWIVALAQLSDSDPRLASGLDSVFSSLASRPPARNRPSGQQATAMVHAALEVIQQKYYDRSLSADQIANDLSVGRNALLAAFRQQGRSVRRDIRTARVSAAVRLLTDLSFDTVSVSGIAQRCGFADLRQLTRALHAVHGVAPLDIRKSRLLPA